MTFRKRCVTWEAWTYSKITFHVSKMFSFRNALKWPPHRRNPNLPLGPSNPPLARTPFSKPETMVTYVSHESHANWKKPTRKQSKAKHTLVNYSDNNRSLNATALVHDEKARMFQLDMHTWQKWLIWMLRWAKRTLFVTSLFQHKHCRRIHARMRQTHNARPEVRYDHHTASAWSL